MIETLIDKLVAINVRIELAEGDNLKVHAGVDKIPRELLEELKQNKEGLISYLKQQQAMDNFLFIPLLEAAEDYLPTPAQKSIWLVSQFEEANIAYNMPGAFVFKGEVDTTSLMAAFDRIIERYEILRTVFRENTKGELRMHIRASQEKNFQIITQDFREEQNRELLVRDLVQKEFLYPFDLANGPLIRAHLFQLEEDTWVFTLVMHHIISDGWSMDILLNEVLSLYNAFATGQEYDLKPLRIQFKEIAAWQHKQLEGQQAKELRNYWHQQFEGTLPVLDLPADKERPTVKTYNGNKWSKQLNRELTDAFRDMLQKNDSTLFMGLLALVNALFSRLTRQNDIIIGTPVAGREHADTLDQVGYFINTLALRTKFDMNAGFRDLLMQTKKVVMDAFRYQAYPFDELVTGLNLQRDISRNPLFDAQVVLQNSVMSTGGKQYYFHKLSVSEYEDNVYSTSVYFTVFSFTDTEEGLRADIMYNSDIFSEEWIMRLGEMMETLLISILAAPDDAVRILPLLDKPHLDKVLNIFNSTSVPQYAGKTVTGIFRQQAKQHPDSMAVIYGDVALTYRQLDEQSDRLANVLFRKYNIVSGDKVGVMLERSDKLPVALLGVMKAGAVYVPLDPAYPAARKEYIIQDTGLQLVITQSEFLFDLKNYNGTMFAIDLQLVSGVIDEPSAVPEPAPGQTAYIIYTSGSTGEPKGVIISHEALANSILGQQHIIDIKEEDRVLQFFPVSFDVSLFEIYLALTRGATLCLISDYEKKDPLSLNDFIRNYSITVATLPAVYLQLTTLEDTPTLRKLVTGGEQADPKKVYAFAKRGTYYNAYGPTESAICVTLCKIEGNPELPMHIIPAGKPIANVQLYITDEYMAPVPIGVTGEIFIGGKGLADGYLNNPSLTNEKFIESPFVRGEKLYRTGDLGRWKADGHFEFAGRVDDQVKIRGHRIELGEIQAALMQCNEVDSCAVVVHNGVNGEPELVAYVTADHTCSAASLRNWLSNIVPVYMIPSAFIQLDELPLTSNGKVDKTKLPPPDTAQLLNDTDYTPPETETEKRMVAIWQEMLGRERVGIRDDYFAIGGNSLKAMSIIKRMIEETGISVPLKLLFEEKTIENILRNTIGYEQTVTTVVNTTVQEAESVPAAWNQRIYFSTIKPLQETVQANYDTPRLDMDILRMAVQELVNRHEILRTVFIEQSGGIYQQVLPPDRAIVTIHEPYGAASFEEMNRMTSNEQPLVFEPNKFPLFAVDVHKIEGDNYYVRFIMHHLVTDGYSNGLITEELAEIYAAYASNRKPQLPALPYHYRHFANWQHQFISSPEGNRQKNYWHGKLSGLNAPARNYPLLKMPIYSNGNGMTLTLLINEESYNNFSVFCRNNSLTKTAVLLGLLHRTVQLWFAVDDVVVTSTVSGRHSRWYGELDLTGVIGFVANTIFVRYHHPKEQDIVDYLRDFQRSFVDDLENQEYPFMKLIEELPGLNPAQFIADSIFFNYHNYPFASHAAYKVAESQDKKVSMSGPQQATCGLAVTEYPDCLELKFLFAGQKFNQEMAEAFTDILMQYVDALTGSNNQPVSQNGEEPGVLNRLPIG